MPEGLKGGVLRRLGPVGPADLERRARDGRILEEGLAAAKVTHGDVLAGIRLAGVGRLEDVAAVVIERNGEFSVLTTPPDADVMVNVEGP